MIATYTFDVFTTLDGFGSYDEPGDWGGYWGKDGPELVDHRESLYDTPQRMVYGAATYREFVEMLSSMPEGSGVDDTWVTRMIGMPTTVISSTLHGA